MAHLIELGFDVNATDEEAKGCQGISSMANHKGNCCHLGQCMTRHGGCTPFHALEPFPCAWLRYAIGLLSICDATLDDEYDGNGSTRTVSMNIFQPLATRFGGSYEALDTYLHVFNDQG